MVDNNTSNHKGSGTNEEENENTGATFTGVVLRNLFQAVDSLQDYPWEPFHEGVEIYRLYENSQGASAALLRYQPGATVPHHTHVGFEHIIVLSGAQSDARGHYPPGTLIVSAPETGHAIASDIGCVVLAIWEKPVAFD